MSLSHDLSRHAIMLVGNSPGLPPGKTDDVPLRRAVSSAYYALFHRLCEAGVDQLAGRANPAVANRIYRSLNHNDAKIVCIEFGPSRPNSTLQDLLRSNIPPDLQSVAQTFVNLQQVRHSADYDPGFQLSWDKARGLVESAVRAIGAWERVQQTPEANVFVLALFLRKNWERDR